MNDQDNAGATHISTSHADTTEPKDPYAIRARCFSHERKLKMIAGLSIFAGGLVTVGSLYVAIVALNAGGSGNAAGEKFGMAMLGLLYGVPVLSVGIGLFALEPWARIVMAILYVPNLIAFPVGTVIAGWFIWTLLSKKSRIICSDDYRGIIAATPDFKRYRRSGLTAAGEA